MASFVMRSFQTTSRFYRDATKASGHNLEITPSESHLEVKACIMLPRPYHAEIILVALSGGFHQVASLQIFLFFYPISHDSIRRPNSWGDVGNFRGNISPFSFRDRGAKLL